MLILTPNLELTQTTLTLTTTLTLSRVVVVGGGKCSGQTSGYLFSRPANFEENQSRLFASLAKGYVGT